VRPILARVPVAASVLVALASAGAICATVLSAGTAAAGQVRPARTVAAGPVRHVVLVGVPGLRWADVSAAATPALWRLARQGSVGSLSVTGIGPLSCPADGWLMLNAGARAAAPRTAAGSCAGLPAVTAVRYRGRTGSGARSRPFTRLTVQIVQMPAIVSANQAYNENPAWGMLRSAAGPGECTTAAGLGAALALASRSGQVGAFLPGATGLTRAELARCPLTVVDLGTLRTAPGLPAATDVRADDQEIGRISAALPAGTILVVAGISDDAAPHLQLLVIRGPGFGPGCSCRRPPASAAWPCFSTCR
jgi:hypothetical protein